VPLDESYWVKDSGTWQAILENITFLQVKGSGQYK
jgi:hypothetical protein